MSTVENGTTGASSIGPASGYNFELSHLLVVFFLFSYKLSANTSNPYDAIMLLIFTHSMICFMFFEIKICHKISKSLTEGMSTYPPCRWGMDTKVEMTHSVTDIQTVHGIFRTEECYDVKRSGS
jgi:hypothetical protein